MLTSQVKDNFFHLIKIGYNLFLILSITNKNGFFRKETALIIPG